MLSRLRTLVDSSAVVSNKLTGGNVASMRLNDGLEFGSRCVGRVDLERDLNKSVPVLYKLLPETERRAKLCLTSNAGGVHITPSAGRP